MLVPASGAASRDPDFNTVDELAGQLSYCSRRFNRTQIDIYLCTTDTGQVVLVSANITFSQSYNQQFTGTVTSSVAVADRWLIRIYCKWFSNYY